MSLGSEPRIDCHCHVLDPARFPYRADTPYRPAGQEIGTAAQMKHVFAAYGIHGALVVGPNSGYEEDNRCLLDAIAGATGRWKGIAVVPHDISTSALERLKAQGIVGVAFNATFHGADHYRNTSELLRRLAALDMCVSLQVERDQLVSLGRCSNVPAFAC
jgi:predicted TIM-barrel fold metal-dependent hydrolase